jgi:hypothetical protein
MYIGIYIRINIHPIYTYNLCMCVCVCVCVCVYVYIYIYYISIFMYVYTYIRMYVCMYTIYIILINPPTHPTHAFFTFNHMVKYIYFLYIAREAHQGFPLITPLKTCFVIFSHHFTWVFFKEYIFPCDYIEKIVAN